MPTTFDALALEVFYFQAVHNSLYAKFLNLLRIDPKAITEVKTIPFLPISFFKNYTIKTGDWKAERILESSGTTLQITSKHELRHSIGILVTQS